MMEKTIEDVELELSDVTLEILSLTDNLKEKTKSSMMIGERHILKGIVIFEEVVKELNPEVINDEVLYMIRSCVNIVLFKEEEKTQRVNNHVHYGVNTCYTMLDLLNKSKKRELVLEN